MENVPPSDGETPPSVDMITSVVLYIQRNWRVIPVHSVTGAGRCTCGNEQCESVGKHPRTRNGVKDASKEYADVLSWWQRAPNANIGIATGNGLLVIDVDPRHGGTLKALDDRFTLPETAHVRTGGDGWHLYYRYDPRVYTLPNTAGKLGEGIDSRGENGYVLAPPSLHVSGKRYTWSMDMPLAWAPLDLLKALLKPRSSLFAVGAPVVPPVLAALLSSAPQGVLEAAEKPLTGGIPEGRRNNSLFYYAALLRQQGADERALSIVLNALNKDLCQPPISSEEVRRICASAARWTPKTESAGSGQVGLDDIELLKDLMGSEIADPQWAMPDFLPEGVTLLAGKPKMGKSWLALDLALAISQGAPALGSLPTRGGHVLYMGLEDSRRRMYDRVRLLLDEQQVPDAFSRVGLWLPLQEGGLAHLETWLKRTPETRLVVIDTLARVRPASSGQVYADDYAALTPLKQLAESYHIAILLIHHLRKNGASDPMDEVSGSTGLTGAADCIMVLQRERGKAQATLTITGRDVRDQSLALTFDEDTARWSVGQPRPRPLSLERRAILDVLKEAGRPLSPHEIALALDKNRSYISKTLHFMVKQQQLPPAQNGLYELLSVEEISNV